MKEQGPGARAANAIARLQAGAASQLRLAVSFLTILPLGEIATENEVVAASFRWFPLVGFILGAMLASEDALLLMVFPSTLSAALVVLTMVILTGAVHLDALADTADATGAGRDRVRALSILRDSRVGVFGATAIVFSLLLKTIALSSLAGHRRFLALFVAMGLSRWSMVAVAGGLEYLRPEGGAGATLLQRDSNGLLIASLCTAAALLFAISLGTASAVLAAIIVTIAARWFYGRWLGGLTGDLIGACGELVEIAVLVMFVAV
jgi:adenosylcobinamide-GDP ribazoletransferase